MPNVCVVSFLPIAGMMYLKTLRFSILNSFDRVMMQWDRRVFHAFHSYFIYENKTLLIPRDEFMQSLKK